MKALITGATKGIGKAIATQLAEAGHDVALVARSLTDLNLMKKALNERFPEIEVVTVSADLTKKFEVSVVGQTVLNHWKTLDILVNNFGLYETGTFLEEAPDTLEKVLRANVLSAHNLAHQLVPGMVAQKAGFVFNICSVLSKEVRREAASYSVSKFALLGMSKVLASEVRENGVKVCAILPGSVNTPSWDGIEVPLATFVQPDDVASVIVNALNFSQGAWMEEIVLRPLDPNF